MAEFELEITTPERQFLKEPVQMVILPGENGELGVMAGHAPLVLVLKSGTVRIKQNDEWRECVTADGRLAREEEAREKEKLRQAQSQREFLITTANLAHAMARLRAVSRHSINNQ